ncbi:MAG: NAD-dependent epimerase/dehydratase family protein [Sphingobacteriaceae bacterium]
MILITGATGFLGSELARQLAKKDKKVRCLKRKLSVIPEILHDYAADIEWFEADILDLFALEDALDGVTQVYHCAAIVSFNPADKKRMIKANVEGTANLVNLCNLKHIRLLHVSSIAAIGEGKPNELINENHIIEYSKDSNAYAVSKYESEMEVWRGIAEGLDAVIVNPSIIIGAAAGAEGSGKIFETVRKGLKFYTAGSCGLVDVQDVASSMVMLMNSDVTRERFIINAENVTYKSLFETTANFFNIPKPQIFAKPWMMEIAWRASRLLSFFNGGKVGLDKISAKAASSHKDYDASKIKNATGIKFRPIDDAIREICDQLTAIATK